MQVYLEIKQQKTYQFTVDSSVLQSLFNIPPKAMGS